MLPSKKYRNNLVLRNGPDPTERRENLTKEILKDSTTLPDALTYKDYDEGMMEWSNNELYFSFEGKELPTVALYTNQRFEEYMQSWKNTDNKKNFLMNFKTITRENNPKKGTMNGNITNIPGDRFYVMRRERIIDKNGQASVIEYKMRQPFAVDLSYTLSVVTSKYELLNDFNTKLQKIFKSGYSYLNIKSHYIYIKLDDMSDESEYAVDDRRYFSQSAKLTVKAYIIEKDDFIVEEKPIVKFICFEGEQKKKQVEVFSEEDALVMMGGLYYKPLSIVIRHGVCECPTFTSKILHHMVVKKITMENIRTFVMKVDDVEVTDFTNLEIEDGSTLFFNITLKNRNNEGLVILEGYDKNAIYNENDLPESELDDGQLSEEINIE